MDIVFKLSNDYVLSNPHGSDGTDELTNVVSNKIAFLTHTVQMELRHLLPQNQLKRTF